MTLWLTACDPGDSEVVVVRFICPTINQYDQATQDKALTEYQALPKDSALRLFVGDYKRLRDQIGVCRSRAAAAGAAK